jgi:hypothetical protein
VTQEGRLKMPDGLPKLPDEDLSIIKHWIEDGVPWEIPDTSAAKDEKK